MSIIENKLLLFSVLLGLAALAGAVRDPELEQCQRQCGKQRQYGEEEIHKCLDKCERYYREKREREKEGGERGRGGSEDTEEEPFEKQLRECEGRCVRKQDERERSECHDRCQREFLESERREREKERGGGRGGSGSFNPRHEGGEREEQSERGQESEPYIFQDQHFSQLQTDHGRIRILERFNERSELLRGIENFRVAIFEANPQTFRVPTHWDADAVFFVQQGRGTISLIRQEKRESFNIRRGDVMRIEAGTTVYMVNRDNNEKFVMVLLIQPVSTPGRFEGFFGPGGENPESFFRAFSSELLEAAFNTKKDKFERVFQQSEGVIIKASEEQIKSMSRHEEGGIWPFGSETKGPYNIFKQGPSHSNQHGQFFEVDPDKCKDLRELNLGLAFFNLSRGSMTAPMYNSRATRIAVVVNGEGYLEIACPHVSQSGSSHGQEGQRGGGSNHHRGDSGSQRQTTPSYQRVSGNLRRGTVFVVPAGHPFITVASQNENLQVFFFEIKGINNEKFQLAGRRNIFNQFEREAKELAFGVSEKEVDEVFKSQKEEFFFRGPSQQREGRAYA